MPRTHRTAKGQHTQRQVVRHADAPLAQSIEQTWVESFAASHMLTVDEVATMLSVTRGTVYAIMRARLLPYLRLPTRPDRQEKMARRIRLGDLHAFVQRYMVGGEPR